MDELTTGIYPLAPDCTAFVRDGKVIVSQKRKAIDETPRCRSCKYFGEGHSTYNQRYNSLVCLARPKENGRMNGYGTDVSSQQRYYATQGQFRACNKYTPKDPGNGKTADNSNR